MKKLFLSLLAFLVFSQLVVAQEDPAKAVGKAGRALDSYNLSPSSNQDKLKEAVQLIDLATTAEVNQNNFKAWQTKGEVYNALSDKDLNAMILNPEHQPERPDAPKIAAESFLKALGLAQKKFETKDAVKGLSETAGKLNNIGNKQIQVQDYAGAFSSLDMVMQVDAALRKNGGDPAIPEAEMGNHKYVVAFCAKAAGKNADAERLFRELFEAGSEEPAVYAEYFNILYAGGNKEKAWQVFGDGQKKFPSSTELLFAGINAKIAEQDYESLTQMLADAIKAEPNNPSVYTALGNVYMNLFTQEFGKDKKSAKAQEYFDQSMSYFNQAINIDPKQFDAIYSIGSLYFNKAVELLKEANELPMTKEGQQQYKVMHEDADKLMGTALPYFQKTEAFEPNDVNTLIALSEIYARMNDFEKSNMFKERLNKVRNGERVDTSYFKN
jgi:tetratricopeptide (TPR) repeat protein